MLAAGLEFPDRDIDVWVPLQQGPASMPRSRHSVDVVGRLAPGATVASAQGDMTALAAELERRHPENRARGAFVESLDEVVRGDLRP